MSDSILKSKISRRNLVKGSLAVATTNMVLPFSPALAYTPTPLTHKADKIVWSSCTVNCGSRCPLRLHVKDGIITYVETDNTGNDIYGDHPQIRACLRGRSMRRRVYNPDRLKYPMKRVGKRGEGKFKRISWEEAYDEISNNLKRIIHQYGNEAIYLNYGTGTLGGTITKSWPPGSTLIARLMNLCGGYLNHYGDYSTAQIAAGLNYTYGGWAAGNSLSDIANTKLVVMFGNNPSETRMSGGGLTYHYSQGLERSNARTIIIDPRYTDSALGKEDEWLPIKPGTDAALVNAIAYVLINENMVDQDFLDTYCVGYDEKTLPQDAPANGHYKAYILGQGKDGIAKTPEWAAKITGISKDKIVKLAREIGQTKPAYICQGWGPQRHANGELTSRAIAMLPILTGNVGISGGNSGARESSFNMPFVRMPTLTNPVKTSISMFLWTDAIYRHHEMTATSDGVRGKERLDVPIKFIWNYASNCITNQHSDINRTHDILQDDSLCEMIVVIDNHMTASAKYADILLPDCTITEQMDFCMDAHSGNTNSIIFADKAIEPQFESRDIYEVLSEIADRMGVKQAFTEGRNREQWLRHLHGLSLERIPDLPSFEQLKQQGLFKKQVPNENLIAYRAFRADPVNNPLKTPSGKIEIYSQQLADIAATWQLPEGDVIDPLPVYASTFEGWDDPSRKTYPLQLYGFHYKARTHSTYGNVDVLQSACRQEVWINPIDAAARGITNGDWVRVFNNRGEIRLNAKVTPRIMPGVSAMGQGAWHLANMSGDRIDHGGCINTLTTQRPSPLAKGNPQHTNLVEIAKV